MTGPIGRTYADGEVIIHQGEKGTCMYVIQEGQVEVLDRNGDREVRLAVRGPGEFIGEMALFEKVLRSAEVRALGPARVLTVDKKNLMTRIQDDPSLAFRLIRTLSSRVRQLSSEVADLKRKG